MLQTACCCGGACPACAGLPSTISATWSATYQTCFDVCSGENCTAGTGTITVSKTFTLTKNCDGTSTRYTGIACGIGTFSACVINYCSPGVVCQNWTIHAAVCITCSSDPLCWNMSASAWAYPALPLGSCTSCNCANLSVSSSVCEIVNGTGCTNNITFSWYPNCGSAASESSSKCGASSPTGTYALTVGTGTLVIT